IIADGVVPSNEDRGYVLRRILRRGIHRGRSLSLESPFMERFTDTALEILGPTYPELVAEGETVRRWVNDEEENFGRTLDRGLQMVRDLIRHAHEDRTSWVEAEDVFRLYDTYGFPYDLTKELLAEEGLAVDDEGFEELMEEQRARSRVATATAHGSEDHHGVVLRFASEAAPSRFVGYEKLRADTSLLAVSADNGHALVKLEESPFYAEGGGQIADSGEIRWDGGSASVADVYRIGDDQAVELDASLDRVEAGSPVGGR